MIGTVTIVVFGMFQAQNPCFCVSIHIFCTEYTTWWIFMYARLSSDRTVPLLRNTITVSSLCEEALTETRTLLGFTIRLSMGRYLTVETNGSANIYIIPSIFCYLVQIDLISMQSLYYLMLLLPQSVLKWCKFASCQVLRCLETMYDPMVVFKHLWHHCLCHYSFIAEGACLPET